MPDTDPLPLYVDLDGTLCRGDTLHESMLALVRSNPPNLLRMLGWLRLGKAGFKQRVADACVPPPDTLVYHQPFLQWLREARSEHRPLVLASAADERVARAVADHLGLFDAVLASNAGGQVHNLSREAKRDAIARHASQQGWLAFAYAGNSTDDLPVWSASAQAIAVDAPPGVWRALARQHPQARVFDAPGLSLRTLFKAVRVTQWAKNALLFVPLLASHQLGVQAWLQMLLAFMAFGLCASATYLVNDLLDLPNDRQHEHKRHRPLAAGALQVPLAVGLSGAMLVAGLALAVLLSGRFAGLLVVYCLVTLAYSVSWKRIALVDVLVLSGLYTLRIVAGAVVAGVVLSNWLLAISLFLFLSLALVKRCAELEEMKLVEATHTPGRGYQTTDLPTLRGMGLASGFLAVLVLALYIDSANVRQLYAQPQWLWGVAPLLLLWIMRMWLRAGRRELHGEDPLQFALRDRISWLVLFLMGVLGLLAARGL